MFRLFTRRTVTNPMPRTFALVESFEERALMSATAWAGPITLVPAVQLPAVQSTTTTQLPAVQITDGTSNTILFGEKLVK